MTVCIQSSRSIKLNIVSTLPLFATVGAVTTAKLRTQIQLHLQTRRRDLEVSDCVGVEH